MAGISDYLENKLLDHVFGATSYSAPATLYVALSTTTPTDSGNVTEPTSGAYARVAVTNNTTNWPNASSGSKSNGVAITFPQATALWGTLTHFVIYDAASNGNMIGFGALGASRTVDFGDVPSFAIGQLTITSD